MANENSKIKGYKIDYQDNLFIMNLKFQKKAAEYGSAEYVIRKNILADFPTMKTVVRSGRTKKAPRYNKNFTYDNMLLYLSMQANSEDLIEKFVEVKKQSKGQKCPYKFVTDWFEREFPDYRTPSPKEVETKGAKCTGRDILDLALKKAS